MSTFELPSMYKCIYCLQGQCTATFLSSTKTWLEKPALFLASHVEVCRGNACGRICSNPVGTSCFDEDRCYNIAHDSALLCTDVPCMQIKKKGMSSYSIQQLFFPISTPSVCGWASCLKSCYVTQKNALQRDFL